MTGDCLQREGLGAIKHVPTRHDHRVSPAIAWHREQTRIAIERFSCDCNIGLTGKDHLGDLPWIALVQGKTHAWEALPEISHHVRQGIASLGMGRCNTQLTGLVVTEFAADRTQIIGMHQQSIDHRGNGGTGVGQADQALAVANEDLHAQFLFQFAYLLGHAGLGGKQALGGLGQVEIAADRLAHCTKLLEIHSWAQERLRIAPLYCID